MANNSPPTALSFPSTGKRSACDRCRGQKLRCTPNPNGSPTCTRCQHLGAQCATSYSRSSGWVTRTPGRSEIAVAVRPTEQSTRSQVPQVTFPEDFASPSREYPWPNSKVEDFNSSWKSGDALSFPMPVEGDFLDASGDGLVFPETSFFSNNICTEEIERNIKNHDFSLSSPNSQEIACNWGGIRSIGSANTISNAEMPDARARNDQATPHLNDITGVFECDSRLSCLGLRLSQRRQAARSASASHKNNALVANGGFPPISPLESGHSMNSEFAPSGSNPYGDALSDTSEFVNILQSYDAAFRNGSTSTSKLSLDIIIILDIVSGYLQLIDIYDCLIADLYKELCGSSKTSSVGLQTLPGLTLAGFSVKQGNLQTSILLQTIIHHFQTAERILGLPLELRVSNRKDVYQRGLLGGERATNLFRAVLDHTDTGGCLKEDSNLRALDTLKSNIEKVQKILER